MDTSNPSELGIEFKAASWKRDYFLLVHLENPSSETLLGEKKKKLWAMNNRHKHVREMQIIVFSGNFSRPLLFSSSLNLTSIGTFEMTVAMSNF